MNAVALVLVGSLVVIPLAREYMEFRRDWGLSRMSAIVTTLLIVPSLAVGVALAMPVGEPVLQWTTTVLVTVALYSLGVSAVRPPAASEAPRRSS